MRFDRLRSFVGGGLIALACSSERAAEHHPHATGGATSGATSGGAHPGGSAGRSGGGMPGGGAGASGGSSGAGGASGGSSGTAGSADAGEAGAGGESGASGQGGQGASGGEGGGTFGGEGGMDCRAATCGDVTGHDADGDGLSDDWERAGGLDLDCDGALEPSERSLTNVDPTFPNGSTNPTPSADATVKDLFVAYDFMVLADDGNACVAAPISGAPFNSPDCALDQYCVSGTCRGHSDRPSAAALQRVVDAFASRGIRLHLTTANPGGIPHSKVVSFGTPEPACSADSAALSAARRHVGFYELKQAHFLATRRFPFHYVLFAHHHSCDSVQDCAKPICANTDSGQQPLFTETGIAEQPGNDVILSMGRLRDRNVLPSVINEAGTFMHELGHNLGLDHGGPVSNDPDTSTNFKPNYLSVMNYAFQSVGIGTAASPGGTTALTTRIDYSSSALPTLDENALDESVGLGAGNDISFTFCPSKTPVPGTGPVDWNCLGGSPEPALAADINNDGTQGLLVGHSDWDHLVFAFQCHGGFND